MCLPACYEGLIEELLGEDSREYRIKTRPSHHCSQAPRKLPLVFLGFLFLFLFSSPRSRYQDFISIQTYADHTRLISENDVTDCTIMEGIVLSFVPWLVISSRAV